jgi:hypothetical protein
MTLHVSEPTSGSPGWLRTLGSVRQVGNIVADLDSAVADWLELGVGPWFVMRDVTRRDGTFRGVPRAARMSLAFANSANLQIELICPLDDVPSAAVEFLRAGRSGMHHIAYWTEQFDEVVADAAAAGWHPIQTSGGRSVYYEFAGAARPLVEVMELNERTLWLTETVRTAALTWDGMTEPVRSLPKRPGW